MNKINVIRLINVKENNDIENDDIKKKKKWKNNIVTLAAIIKLKKFSIFKLMKNLFSQRIDSVKRVFKEKIK